MPKALHVVAVLAAFDLVRMLYECGRFAEIPEMWRIVESATC